MAKSYKIICPKCEQKIECQEKQIGTVQTCPACKQKININKPKPKEQENKVEGLTFASDYSRSQKVYGTLITVIAIIGVIAFAMIGYLAIPLMKEKTVWNTMSQERQGALENKLNTIQKAKEEIIEKLDADIKEKKQIVAKVNADIEGMEDKIKNIDVLNNRLADIQKSIDNLNKQYKVIEGRRRTELSDKIQPLTEEVNGLKRAIDEYEKKLSTRKQDLASIESELKKKQDSLIPASKRLTAIEKETQDLRKEALKIEKEMQTGKIQKEQLEKVRKEYPKIEEAYNSLLEDSSKLRDAHAKLRKDIQKESEILEGKKSVSAGLDRAIKIKKDNLERLASDKTLEADLKASVKRLETQKDFLEGELTTLTKQYKDLKLKNEKLSKKNR